MVGCIRKLQNRPIEQVLEEYIKHSTPKERKIDQHCIKQFDVGPVRRLYISDRAELMYLLLSTGLGDDFEHRVSTTVAQRVLGKYLQYADGEGGCAIAMADIGDLWRERAAGTTSHRTQHFQHDVNSKLQNISPLAASSYRYMLMLGYLLSSIRWRAMKGQDVHIGVQNAFGWIFALLRYRYHFIRVLQRLSHASEISGSTPGHLCTDIEGTRTQKGNKMLAKYDASFY